MLTIKIAIVDDNDLDVELLQKAIEEFQNSHKDSYSFNITRFNRGINFIEPFNDVYDAVLLDIDMPVMSGMETAKIIREKGSNTSIVFVTNYASLAIDGYGVGALDFLVKPVKYIDVERSLMKIINKVENENDDAKIVIKLKSGYQTILLNNIKYIEVSTHDVFYYTTQGMYKTREVLKNIEKDLNSPKFVRCSSAFLINLDYVDSIEKDDIRIDGKRIKIARTRKKEFIAAYLNNYQ